MTNDELLSLPRTRAEAKAAGSMFYYKGEPCTHGHLSERYASDGKCVTCRKARNAKHREENPEAYRESGRKSDRKEYARREKLGLCAQRGCIELRQEHHVYCPKHAARRGVRTRIRNWLRRRLPLPTRPEPTHCECCGKLPRRRRGYRHCLNLDHCHITGAFRGWICDSCNRKLGSKKGTHTFYDCFEGIILSKSHRVSKGAGTNYLLDYLQACEPLGNVKDDINKVPPSTREQFEEFLRTTTATEETE
ncbi:MAG TPA: endonuclease domain-containing protein [Gammaproteobacteria bacterium]|nr:endonuclease domain-containing protein [Gammaproteobacteria bacterium]